MNKSVTTVFKMVVGGKENGYFLVNNYADMVKVMKCCNRGLITDLEAIKALCNLSDENQGKEVFKVTQYQYRRCTEY